MSLTSAIFLNGLLDLGIVLAVAAIMRVPFMLDRRADEAAIYSLAPPLRREAA
jgi:hypothetical protein